MSRVLASAFGMLRFSWADLPSSASPFGEIFNMLSVLPAVWPGQQTPTWQKRRTGLRRCALSLRVAYRLPHPHRRRRHLEMPDAERPQRVVDGVHHRGESAYRASLGRALDAER